MIDIEITREELDLIIKALLRQALISLDRQAANNLITKLKSEAAKLD